jgi:very-short-patch-repair endonuclease
MVQPKRIRDRERLIAYRKAKAAPVAPSSVPTPWAMKNRATLLVKHNKAEAHIEAVLKRAGLLFTREAPIRYNGRDYFMDFAVETSLGIVCIEVDGAHHMRPKAQSADRIREDAILRSGEASVIIRMSWAVALTMDKSIRDVVMWACACPGSVILRY